MVHAALQAFSAKRDRRPPIHGQHGGPRSGKAIALCIVTLFLSACAAVQTPCNLRLHPASGTTGAQGGLTPSEYDRYLSTLGDQAFSAERTAATTALAEKDRLSRRLRLAMVLGNGSAKDIARGTALLEEGLREERGLITCDKVAAELVLDSLKDRRRMTSGVASTGTRRSPRSASQKDENAELKQELKSLEEQNRSLTRQLEQLKAIEKQIEEREREVQSPTGTDTSDAKGQNPAGR